VSEYRQDDETRGWCPICGMECVAVTDTGKGFCEEHEWVFVNWAPPEKVPAEDEE
jgi:hypothetical protein